MEAAVSSGGGELWGRQRLCCRSFFEHVPPCHFNYRRPPPLNGSARNNGQPREKTNETFHPSVRDRCCSSAVEREPPRAHTANLHSPLHDGASVKLLTRHATPRHNFSAPLPRPHAAQRFTLYTNISCPSRPGSASRADSIRHEQWGAPWGGTWRPGGNRVHAAR